MRTRPIRRRSSTRTSVRCRSPVQCWAATISAAFLARIIDAPVGRWADAAAIPLLIAIGFGKLAQLLGGSGQGLPFDGPWAVAFLGNGPWISADPALPSHPSQVYEGLWALAGIPIVLAWTDAATSGSAISSVRAACSRCGGLVPARPNLVGFTWRDDKLIGPQRRAGDRGAGDALLVVLIAWPTARAFAQSTNRSIVSPNDERREPRT